jgi:IS5 family transposase
VLSRSLERIACECQIGALEVVNHTRAVKHRLLEISRAAKCLTQTNQQRRRDSYQKLLALTRWVVRQASEVMQRWGTGRMKVVGKLLRVETQIGQLRHFVPWIEKVIHQTQQPVWGGDTHVEDQLLSLFETHTQVIRKGKAHKPDEFGRLVRIDEVENGMVSGYQVLEGNPDDTTAWVPALKQHQLASGERRRWPPATADFFLPRTSGRRKPWACRRWRCRVADGYRPSRPGSRSSAGSDEHCAGRPAVKPSSAP